MQITTLTAAPSGATVQVQFPAAPSTTTTTTTPPVTTPPTTTSPPPPAGTTGASFVKPIANATKSQSGNATLSVTVAAGGGAAVGHRVIVAAGVGTFGGAVGCSDSRGNTYTVDARNATNNLFVCSAHVTSALQAGYKITLTYPGFSGVSVATVYDFAGLAPASAVDGSRVGASTSTKNVTVAPALVTGAPGQLLFAAVGGSTPFTARSGFSPAGSFGSVCTQRSSCRRRPVRSTRWARS